MVIENEYSWAKAKQNNDTESFHKNFDNALERVRKQFGRTYPAIVAGKEIISNESFEVRSPADSEILVSKFSIATKENVLDAIEAAKDSFEKWKNTDYEKRAGIFKTCADEMSQEKFEIASIVSLENGKNRVEAMNDVDEAIDFLRYYSEQLVVNHGYVHDTPHPDPKEKTKSVLKPYGVWGVISPFNFPSAIATGMASAVLITGNTEVFKPSSDAPLSAYRFVEKIYHKLPPGAVNFVPGPGSIVGKTLFDSQDVDGMVFTGSAKVGLDGFKKFTESYPRPFISEMGGKNPCIVTKNADLDKAANGVVAASFGFGGQKCSACSRVYVQKQVSESFLQKVIEKTKSITIGKPWQKQADLGPMINKESVEKFEKTIQQAKKDGAEIVIGGQTVQSGELARGLFVEPTIIKNLPEDHQIVKEELFLPLLHYAEFEEFGDAIAKANDTEYGLTAGIFSQDKQEVKEFFEKIQAGTVYANRQASATTASMVQAQPFVGWKKSGISGKGTGSKYYLPLFLKEQSQTVYG